MLRNLEWFNIPFLVGVLWTIWSPGSAAEIWQRLVAYGPVAGLLAVGGWYWHLKLLEIRDRRPIGPERRVLIAVQRWAPRVLAVITVAMGASWVGSIGMSGDRTWATGFLVLAWAEYVNYFRVQLTHDTRSDLARLWRTRRLRPSWLASDLATWRSEKVERVGPPTRDGQVLRSRSRWRRSAGR